MKWVMSEGAGANNSGVYILIELEEGSTVNHTRQPHLNGRILISEVSLLSLAS